MKPRTPWTWEAPKDDWEKTPLPMRPSGDDLTFREEAIAEWATSYGAPRALVMGVTPQYYRLPWPEGTSIVALDRSLPMIESVWPGPRGSALLADWTAIPLGHSSRDVVLCDGGLSILDYPAGLALAAGELTRIIAPGGLAIFRLYVPPAVPITVEQVLRDAQEGRVETSMELSILLWGALMDPVTTRYRAGVSLDAMESLGIEARELFAQCGWDPDGVKVLEDFRKSEIYLYFPTAEQVGAEFAPGFRLEKLLVPSYRLGYRFPTAIFRRMV